MKMETETDKVLVVDTIYREHELEAKRPIYKDETQQNASDKEIIDALEQESLNHTQNDVDWLNTRDPRAFTFIDVAASGKNVGCLIKISRSQQHSMMFCTMAEVIIASEKSCLNCKPWTANCSC